jgi:dynein heavy chain
VLKGVKINRINPKSINKHELIGIIDSKSGVWKEGILTSALRVFGKDLSSRKKWVHLDGPIDHDWAENLNSILDENLKINLPNGEKVSINSTTNLIFETDSL